jgi:hypothetical protein
LIDDLKPFGQFKQLNVRFGKAQAAHGKSLRADARVGPCGEEINPKLGGIPILSFDSQLAIVPENTGVESGAV